jgi:hypothetical protein
LRFDIGASGIAPDEQSCGRSNVIIPFLTYPPKEAAARDTIRLGISLLLPLFNTARLRVANLHQPPKKVPNFGSLQLEVAPVQAGDRRSS